MSGFKRVVDDSPVSEFIAKMKACFEERLAVADPLDKKAVERKMEGIMREYLGRSVWDAADSAQGVPRGTTRDPIRHGRRGSVRRGGGRYREWEFDGKLAAAGKDED